MEIIKGTLVTGKIRQEESILWNKEAEERLQKVSNFVRPMAQTTIERYAADYGHSTVTTEVMNKAKKKSGM